MAGEFGGLSFRGAIGSILSNIGRFFNAFGGITAKDILRAVAHVKDGVTQLETQHTGFLWGLGKLLGSAFTTIGVFIRDHTKPFLKMVGDKLTKLEKWLKDKFAPLLAFLKTIKDHINEFYRTWIRPIIDTIEFIRAVNRVLSVFHINFLQALDRKLQQLETRLEAPFDWTNRILTEIANALDRIMTFDGLFQRIALVKSLGAYAPAWLRIAVHAREGVITEADYNRVRGRARSGVVENVPEAIELSIRIGRGPYETFTDEFAQAWKREIEAA